MNNREKMILKYMMLNRMPPFEYRYFNEDGVIDLIFYFGDKSKVNVPKSYKKTPIKKIRNSCYCYNEKINEAIIQEGIEVIE